MSSESGHIENIERDGEAHPAAHEDACGACGARPRRREARFCATCGRRLGTEYFPTDALRASYRFERRPAAPRRPTQASDERRRLQARLRPAGTRDVRAAMPPRSENGAVATALAFVTYALVPYLGILFCPGALLFGGVGLLRAWRAPHAGHARAAALSIALGLLVLCAQLLLWWILYKVPQWSRQADF
jgi:hypothetical protein